jgi:glutathione S-transferase
MIVLHQPPRPPPPWAAPNPSPFCAKLETYLRMAGLEYEQGEGDPRKAPKGKIPWITDGDTVMGDTGLIIDYLKKKYGDPLDAHLDADARAKAHLLRRAMEEGTYFYMAWLRWSSDEGWPHMRAYFMPLMPPVIGGPILGVLRGRFLKKLAAQGTGLHSRDEVLELARQDVAAYAQVLGDRPYFMGAEPTSLDATMYGFLVNLLGVPWESPEKSDVKRYANLVAYCERMKARYWSV